MTNKGLDSTFIHYGIRKEDMAIIEKLAEEHQINFDWLQEYVLKEFHTFKTNNEELDANKIGKILEKALNKL